MAEAPFHFWHGEFLDQLELKLLALRTVSNMSPMIHAATSALLSFGSSGLCLFCRTLPARLISLRTRGSRSPAGPGGAPPRKVSPNRTRKGRFACLLVRGSVQAGHNDPHPSAARHQ